MKGLSAAGAEPWASLFPSRGSAGFVVIQRLEDRRARLRGRAGNRRDSGGDGGVLGVRVRRGGDVGDRFKVGVRFVGAGGFASGDDETDENGGQDNGN